MPKNNLHVECVYAWACMVVSFKPTFPRAAEQGGGGVGGGGRGAGGGAIAPPPPMYALGGLAPPKMTDGIYQSETRWQKNT